MKRGNYYSLLRENVSKVYRPFVPLDREGIEREGLLLLPVEWRGTEGRFTVSPDVKYL